ncbi:glucosaminidase domain-containing protein [Candidatus Enterococcus moelleringii]|uniref:glucosaminidase domain-containing protein n=1 Tax=Candidatus Enterococcus moelleringii TaxID=2815325 RepID=UPI001F620E60|nr:glucosaminidase domain-containing protein [Enterococcus sp. 669A]
MKKRQKYQRLIEQEIFRSGNRNRHPKIKKGIIGTTTLLGSASIALNSTSVLVHAAESTVSTENKAAADETAPTSGSLTFESKTAAKPVEAKEEPQTKEGTINSTQPEETTSEKTESSVPIVEETEEQPVLDPVEEETPTPDPSEEVPVPTPDPSEEEEKPAPAPDPSEEEQPAPTPDPVEEETPTPDPVKEAIKAEEIKPAEPVVEAPASESTYEVIYQKEEAPEPVVIHSPENVVVTGPQQTTVSGGSIRFDRNLTTTEFIEEIGEAARKIGQEEDLYASVMIAQAILESGSGGSQLAQAPHYNLFGIKGSHEGKSVSFATQEDTGGGNMTTIQASFRAYDDYEASFADYAKLMKEGITGNPEFYQGTWKSNTENYEEATAFLTGKYATDTSYNKKLNGLIETYNLTQYDQPLEEGQVVIQGQATNQVASSGYLLPLNDFVVSSPFGMRGSEFHRGIDLAAGEGTPIFASKAGTVLIAEAHYSWGNYVAIQHDNGEVTLYAHQRNYAVSPGQRVEQGEAIGFVGSTGNSTGSHLHFELCLDSSLAVERLVDPGTVLF